MDTWKYIIQRLFHSIFVLIGLSILIFVIARLVPGDPARTALGPRAPQWSVDKLREEMHLDKPIYVQYFYWAEGALHGDLGESLVTRRDVSSDIKEFFPASLELALYTGILMGLAGIILGVIAGWNNNKWVDNVVRLISYIGIITPSFVFAIFFVLLFGYILGILPTMGRFPMTEIPPPTITGFLSIDALLSGNWGKFIQAQKHMIMPAVALAMGPLSQEARLTRSSIVSNIRKDYIASERSCGFPERVIMFKYLLKPSVTPTVSIFGLDFASIIGNAFVVELIFNWPGLSRYGMNAMLQKDLNAIVAVVMVYGILFMVVNLLVDIVNSFLDPRIRIEARTKG
jgi:peptide/nickel transport system permease protein